MKTIPQCVRTTLIFGLVCSLGAAPLLSGLNQIVALGKALQLTLWIYMAAYSWLLARWSGTPWRVVLLPLILSLIALFGGHSIFYFGLLSAVALGWLRSGICFPQAVGKKAIVEAILSLGGCALVLSVSPLSALPFSLAVWMFFLFQALYFSIFNSDHRAAEHVQPDAFEQARQKAETILALDFG